MANKYASRHIVVGILQIFRDAANNRRPMTATEIREALRIDWWPYDVMYDYDLLFLENPESADGILTGLLVELMDLGLIQRASPQPDIGLEQWQVADSWKPPDGDGDSGNGGRRGPPAGAGGDGGEGDGGAGGIQEVLGHARLFALPDQEFDELVDGLFSGVEP